MNATYIQPEVTEIHATLHYDMCDQESQEVLLMLRAFALQSLAAINLPFESKVKSLLNINCFTKVNIHNHHYYFSYTAFPD